MKESEGGEEGGNRKKEREKGKIHKVHHTCTCKCNMKLGNIIKCVNIQ